MLARALPVNTLIGNSGGEEGEPNGSDCRKPTRWFRADRTSADPDGGLAGRGLLRPGQRFPMLGSTGSQAGSRVCLAGETTVCLCRINQTDEFEVSR